MKAVIMAGGKGERLYPLTAETPKPLVRISGRPIMEYILALLEKNRFDEVIVTLGYRGEEIEKYFGSEFGSFKIKYKKEPFPLGTAGGVKNAIGRMKEPFLVISGDAMCDFDLFDLMESHRRSDAEVTIASYSVNDPREYGIIASDKENRVISFLEKPGWNQAVTDLVNTGIYVISPEVMRYVPVNEYYDFSRQLFPLLLENNVLIQSRKMEGYWCDIGNTSALHQCQRDMLNGKIHLPAMTVKEEDLPVGNYRIIPPCHIGKSVSIGEHAVIGPYTVLDDGCKTGNDTRIEDSVIGCRTVIDGNVSIFDSLVDCDCVINEHARLNGGSVLGEGALVGKEAEIKPGTVLPPKSVVDGVNNKDAFVSSSTVSFSSPWQFARYAYALGLTKAGRRVSLCYETSPVSLSLVHAVKSGFYAAGNTVFEFPDSFCAQTMFFTVRYGTGVGIHIDAGGGISVYAQGGLPLDWVTKKQINRNLMITVSDNYFSSRQYLQNDGNSAYKEYLRGMCANSDVRFVKIHSKNHLIQKTADELFGDRVEGVSEFSAFFVSPDGMQVTAKDEKGNDVAYYSLLSLCCEAMLREHRDISVQYAAPVTVNLDSEQNDARILRYLSESDGISDGEARRLAARQLFLRDGLMMAVFVSGIMKKSGKSLSDLTEPYRNVINKTKSIRLSVNPTRICGILNGETDWNGSGEGVFVAYGDASALIIPDATGLWATVFARADTMEAAEDLTGDIERKIGLGNS